MQEPVVGPVTSTGASDHSKRHSVADTGRPSRSTDGLVALGVPEDDVQRIYSASAKVRRTLNHQPKSEPTSADEVLALWSSTAKLKRRLVAEASAQATRPLAKES